MGEFKITGEALSKRGSLFVIDNVLGNAVAGGIEDLMPWIMCADDWISKIITDDLNKKLTQRNNVTK